MWRNCCGVGCDRQNLPPAPSRSPGGHRGDALPGPGDRAGFAEPLADRGRAEAACVQDGTQGAAVDRAVGAADRLAVRLMGGC